MGKIVFDWSGIVALIGGGIAYGTIQADAANTKLRIAELAATQNAQLQAASSLATKGDVDVITRRLDGLYQLILQSERRPDGVR